MAANIRKSGSDFFIEIDGIAIRCTLEDIKVLSKKCTYVCLEHGLFSQHHPVPGTGRLRDETQHLQLKNNTQNRLKGF